MQEYNTIQRQLDDITGTISAQRHEEQRKFAEAITTAIEPRIQGNRVKSIVDEHYPSAENRAQGTSRSKEGAGVSQSARLSIALPIVAQYLTDLLAEAAGEEIAFVLVCQADGVAQYVSNTERADGAALIESLLERWKAGRADIPAHYNPDLVG